MANVLTLNDMVNAQPYPVGLKTTVVAGAATATNIAVTDIATTDKIVSCMQVDRNATAANITYADLTSECSITSAGNIQLSTTTTTGDVLVVTWYDKVA
jgi:hypothetical protein